MQENSARRILSVFLPRLPTDRLKRQWARQGVTDKRPLVLIVKAESAMRLSAVDEIAARLGLRPGMALADARAMIPELCVHDADLAADAALLGRLADWCERYSPLVALDGSDGLLLDVTGVTHLFGAIPHPPLEGGSKNSSEATNFSGRGHFSAHQHYPSPKFASQISTLPQGEGGRYEQLRNEAAMLDHICRAFAELGFVAQGAMAGTAQAASALARFAPGTIAAPDEDANTVSPLSIAALAADPNILHGLKRAGLKTIGAVASRGRGELAARFGQSFVALFDRTLGRAESPISPRTPLPDLMAERRFAEPIVAEDIIVESLHALATRLGEILEKRGQGARALTAFFFRADGKMRRIGIETAEPTRDADKIARLFHERLAALADPLDAGFGFDLIRLSATRTQTLESRLASFDANENEKREIAYLIDRLAARFGAQRIQRFLPQDTHIPESSAVTVPAQYSVSTKTSFKPVRVQGEAPRRPLRLFAKPEPIEVMAEVPDGPPVRFRWRRVLHQVARAEGPERIAMEWWKRAGPTRDYFRIEDEKGRRFWLYRDGLYTRETNRPHWYVHGVFA